MPDVSDVREADVAPDSDGILATVVPVTACGGVIYRIAPGGADVLLIYRNGYWDLPKGHLDEGETLEHCAVREVSEETGIATPMLVASLVHTYHTYVYEGCLTGKTTWWYAMVSDAKRFSPQSEEGIEKVCWFPLDKACAMVEFDTLKQVLQALKQSALLQA